jgi:hypothetical protein
MMDAQIHHTQVRRGIFLAFVVLQAQNCGDREGFVVGSGRVAPASGVLLLGEVFAEGVGWLVFILGKLLVVQVVVAQEVGQGSRVVVMMEHFLAGSKGIIYSCFSAENKSNAFSQLNTKRGFQWAGKTAGNDVRVRLEVVITAGIISEK